jgi:hypothetical protein
MNKTTADLIRLDVKDNRLEVKVPENNIFKKRALQLGGYWENSVWNFDLREKDLVSNACREIFGSDGTDNEQLVDIAINVKEGLSSKNRAPLYLFGKMLVYAREKEGIGPLRIEPVQVSGVIVTEGSGFEIKGTSERWQNYIAPGNKIILRDVIKKRITLEEEGTRKKIQIEIIK